MKIELTEKEVKGVGMMKWYAKNGMRRIIYLIVSVVLACLVAYLIPESWNIWVRVLLIAPLVAPAGIVALKLTIDQEKAGVAFLEEMKKSTPPAER